MTTAAEVVIESELHDTQQLRAALSAKQIPLSDQPSASGYRMDPTVLAAIVTGGAAIIAAIVQVLAALPAVRKRTIRIETADGEWVEITPGDAATIEARVAGLTVVRISVRAA